MYTQHLLLAVTLVLVIFIKRQPCNSESVVPNTLYTVCNPHTSILCSTKCLGRFFGNIIRLPGYRNKRKSVLEIPKMYYF